jgi:hypothetical protein
MCAVGIQCSYLFLAWHSDEHYLASLDSFDLAFDLVPFLQIKVALTFELEFGTHCECCSGEESTLRERRAESWGTNWSEEAKCR